MSYFLGVDLGTTFTSAAVFRNGRATTVTLGNHVASISSVVFAQDDGTILTGDAASRRGVSEPERVGREFKRRLGDTQPLFLGGVPYSAEQLTSQLLRSVIDEVRQREDGDPDGVAISHPANWGPYKTDLLRQSVEMAGLPTTTILLTEPEAAAIFYAEDERLDPGQTIAVYDLGGGTFDAAVLRKTDEGFEFLGTPVGIERMGGIDFDAAVFAHVSRALGDDFEALDPEDHGVVIAVARLRQECTVAREALSADTAVTIPVLLPGISTQVRLTRGELETMARPGLGESVAALRRALDSAGVGPDDLHAVLLVGGCSRMPLVSQLLSAELSRPPTLASDPTHAVAVGAAHAAAHAGAAAPAEDVAPVRESTTVDDAPPEPAASEAAPTSDEEPPDGAKPTPEEVGPFVPSVDPTTVVKKKRASGMLVGLGVVALVVFAGVVYLLTSSGSDSGDQRIAGEPSGEEPAADDDESTASTSADQAEPTTSEPTESVAEEPAETSTKIPIRATVDEGSMAAVDETNPAIGTNTLASSLTPAEYIPERQIEGQVTVFVDRSPTTMAQFYDFATFTSAVSDGDPSDTWAELVPQSWLQTSADVPTDLSDLGLPAQDPVAGVTWAAADAYCTYALKRLPTEIEWELVAVRGLIDYSAVQNWVAEPAAYGEIPTGERVLRGSFGIEDLPVYFRNIGETQTNVANAGIRCAADEITEIARPSGELLYVRDFSGNDVARDWPDLHDAAKPEVVFGYHAPDVFHVEAGGPFSIAVVSGQLHTEGTEVSADVDLRRPDPGDGEFRYGLLARLSESGALALLVHPQINDAGEMELNWCINRMSDAILTEPQSGFRPSSAATCEREGTRVVTSFRNRLTISFSSGDAEFFIDETKIDTMFHELPVDGTFGFIAEAFEGDPLLHVHFDNLAVKTA